MANVSVKGHLFNENHFLSRSAQDILCLPGFKFAKDFGKVPMADSLTLFTPEEQLRDEEFSDSSFVFLSRGKIPSATYF